MKMLPLLMVLLCGCSVSRFYKTPEVSHELQKNSQRLQMISSSVQEDFLDKESFYKKHQQENKNINKFILDDLGWRLADLKSKKDSILAKTTKIKSANDGLLDQLGEGDLIKETDPVFNQIVGFQKIKENEANHLFKEFDDYKVASSEFTRFVFFTRNSWVKSSETKR